MRLALSCAGLLFCLLLGFAALVGGGALLFAAVQSQPAVDPVTPTAPVVVPVTPVTPVDEPTPDAEPITPLKPDRRKPWGPRMGRLVESLSVEQRGGGLVHDGPVHGGVEVQIDLPADILKRNIASKGLGCCVFRSLNYCGLWQNVPEVIDLPEKMVKAGIEGGGFPQKVDRIMKQFAPNVKYIQVENGDWSVVKLALRTGRCVAITYQPAHMVCLVHLKDGIGCYRDNNKTGASELEWGSEETIKQKSGGNRFWAVILLNGRPPAPPRAAHAIATGVSRRHPLEQAPWQSGEYEWRRFPDTLDQFALWRDGIQIGVFTSHEDYYREHLGDNRWGQRYHRPPVPLPADALSRLQAMPAGVALECLGAQERYSLCGQEISRDEAQAVLEDDSAKLSLTAIGEPAETARVKAELDRPENAQLKSHVIFQAYTRSNWAVSPQRYGFDVSGHPTVLLQKPDGEVLWHASNYDAGTFTGLRKADPNYKPENDPGMPRAPGAAPALPSFLAPVSIVGLVLAGGLFLLGVAAAGVLFLIHLFWE